MATPPETPEKKIKRGSLKLGSDLDRRFRGMAGNYGKSLNWLAEKYIKAGLKRDERPARLRMIKQLRDKLDRI